ncbi:TMEM175 family protein [Microbacterium sp. NPDC058389]|uniref:TMEM175 family protein n=1 Tax=Microbacterium sp. NPDC058389 TaxID=3346475 RepID=UPI0036522A76
MSDDVDRVGVAAPLLSADRLKAFTDAVVAIAMTLLILPLMESVTELGREGVNAAEWLDDESTQLLTFALSFVLIANFWVSQTNGLVWLTVAWMFTIVWLPVATAIVGQMETDATQKVLYIGSLLATSLMLMVTRLTVMRHPELHRIEPIRLRHGLAADVIMAALFALALAASLLIPALGYYVMFLLLLTWPLHRLATNVIDRRAAARSGGAA